MADFLLDGQGGPAGEYPSSSAGNHPGLGAALIGAVTGTAVLVVLARCFRRLEVEGDSMRPTLLAGDRVLVLLGARPRPGDVVVLTDAGGRLVIKRVATVESGNRYRVIGDNFDASTDSRHFGLVQRNAILGRVIWRYGPEERRGRIPLSASNPAAGSDSG